MSKINWDRSNQQTRMARNGYESSFNDCQNDDWGDVYPTKKKKKTLQKTNAKKSNKAQKHLDRLKEFEEYGSNSELIKILNLNFQKRVKKLKDLSSLLKLIKKHSPGIINQEQFQIINQFISKHKELLNVTAFEARKKGHFYELHKGKSLDDIEKIYAEQIAIEKFYAGQLNERIERFQSLSHEKNQEDELTLLSSIKVMVKKIANKRLQLDPKLMKKVRKIISTSNPSLLIKIEKVKK
jgi:formate dehydrogenase maturation protein FdhE